MRQFWTVVALMATVHLVDVGPDAAATTQATPDFAGDPENTLERRLFADAADGRLDEFSPLAAALVASGVDNLDVLRRYEQKTKSLVDQLRSFEGDSPFFVDTRTGTVPCQSEGDSPDLRAGDDESVSVDAAARQRVEIVFNFLHRRVLRGGYDLAATDLRRTFDEGRFNCISATVLFNYFASQLGLDCRGLEMPSHAMSRVVFADRVLDVETTCPCWFQLMSDPQPQTPTVSHVTATAAGVKGDGPLLANSTTGTVPRGVSIREVSPIQLVAMIYYNRGVDLLAEKRFAEAAAANAKSLRLDPGNATARGNLLATINNWSIHLGDSQQFAEAVELLRRGLAIDAKFEPFAQNYDHVHHQWVEHLCQQGHFEEAIAVLSRAMAEMPNRDYLRRAKSEVQRRWTKAAVSARN
jgi:tetratricopeptide (TPR) repeat protein